MNTTCLIAFAVSMITQSSATPTTDIIRFQKPATSWENEGLPIGNGSLGGMLYGEPSRAVLQFNVDSLWTGDENPSGNYSVTEPAPGAGCFGAFQNFGELIFEGKVTNAPKTYSRQLDIANSLHTTTWQEDGVTFTQEALASHPDEVIAWRFTASNPGSIKGTLRLKGAHPEGEATDIANPQTLRLSGTLANGLKYEARAQIIATGGKVVAGKDHLEVQNCDELLVLLAADTNYVMDLGKKWMSGNPADRVAPRLKNASTKSWKGLLTAHQTDYRQLFDRVAIDLGKSDVSTTALPINERIARYREQARELPRPCLDPELEALLFQYGRYLLISCSRQGTLPANLQGLWNNSNKPAWSADYHTNINLQMCYWLAESANLSELASPLFDMLTSGAPVYRKFTALEYGAETKGYVTRMSLNPFGGGGWNWNIEGTAWLSQHYWEHYRFSLDKTFLHDQAWPWMRDVSLFWLDRLKKLPDGTLVVPNAWSHEHGPHEDGTAHAQQLMWDLFTSTLEAARTLKTDPVLQSRLTATLEKLHGPEIGSWGQLMEWKEEKPDFEKSNHRHTSHLFAVHPGEQISLARTPEFAEAARVSLTQRGEVGDSRRSWTWAWRTALWARLGDPERAHGCIAGLLAHNTLDNLWTTHPPFQIDGNMGITAGMIELFLQSHGGEIALLPALPSAYPTGSISGLRARGEVIVDIRWQDGKLVEATLKSPIAQSVTVRLPGSEQSRDIALQANQPSTIDFSQSR